MQGSAKKQLWGERKLSRLMLALLFGLSLGLVAFVLRERDALPISPSLTSLIIVWAASILAMVIPIRRG